MKSFLQRILPAPLWNILKDGRRLYTRTLRGVFEFFGFTVALKSDYYSPLPAVSQLKQTATRWNKPSAFKGISYDVEAMENTFSSLLTDYSDEFAALPPFKELINRGFGPGFTAVDGLTLYLMIRHLKPNRYIEVGSGLSTYYCSLACDQNAREGHPIQITCIEPYPYPKLYSIPGIQINATEVQDVEIATFQQLQANDILFIDSSHILKIGGDVAFLCLEVLPALNPGVVIHIHDVPFPYNIPYPPEKWIFQNDQPWPYFWNEAMVLQAFLAFNDQFEIIMATPLIRYHDEAFLQKHIPFYETVEQNPNTFSSVWLRRR